MTAIETSLTPPPYPRRRSKAANELRQAYDAGATDRIRKRWIVSDGSADADILPNLPTIRERSRDIVRNDALAAGVIRTLVDNVVGAGMKAQSSLDPVRLGLEPDEALRLEVQIEEALERFGERVDVCGRCDMTGLLRMAYRSMLENGDSFAHVVRGLGNRTAVELIEADRVSDPFGSATEDRLRGGVEIGDNGQPVAYHVQMSHPGDRLRALAKREWRRLRRFSQTGRPNVLHLFEQLRIGQNRGVPFLTAALSLLDDRYQYQTAELFAAKLNAFWAATIEKEGGFEGGRDRGTEESDGRIVEEMGYGAIEYLEPGEQLKIVDPKRPGSSFQVFRDAAAADIGASVGLSWELVTKDFTKTTWHSARQSGLEASRTIRSQQELVRQQLAAPLREIGIEEAVVRGEIDIPLDAFRTDRRGWLSARWSFQTRGQVDPVAENTATEMALKAGLTTLADEAAARNRDWQEVIEQRAKEKEYEEGVRRRSAGSTEFTAAHIASATQIVEAVSTGTIPRDAGLGSLQVLLGLSQEQAAQILGQTAGAGFQPAQEGP